MTTPRQRARICRLAHAIIAAEYLRNLGELDHIAAIMEQQRTMPLDLEQEVAIAYLLATQGYTEATGEVWGA